MATVALSVLSSFLAMLATLAVLVATSILDSAAGSRVDVGEVPRAGFRQPFHLEINPYPAINLLEGGGAAHAGALDSHERNLG